MAKDIDQPAPSPKQNSFGDGTEPVTPNETPGIIYARDRNGKEIRVPVDANGKMTKEFKKKEQEAALKRTREALDQIAKQKAEVEAKLAAEELAKQERLKLKNIAGGEVGLECEVPGVGKIETKTEVGRRKTPGEGDVTVDLSVDFSKFSDKIPKGCKVVAVVRANAKDVVLKANGSEETAKSADEKAKVLEKVGDKIDEIKAESAKIRDTAVQMGLEGKSPQEINAYFTSANAELVRKYGAQAGEYAVWGPDGKPPAPKD